MLVSYDRVSGPPEEGDNGRMTQRFLRLESGRKARSIPTKERRESKMRDLHGLRGFLSIRDSDSPPSASIKDTKSQSGCSPLHTLHRHTCVSSLAYIKDVGSLP